jgi:maltose O-acetyltransferase
METLNRRFVRCMAACRRVWFRALSGGYPQLKGRPIRTQPLLIKGEGTIEVGEKVHFGFQSSAGFWSGYAYLDLRHQGGIRIGDRVMINNNPSLTADGATITIGNDVVIGTNLNVETSDGHSLDPGHRHDGSYPCLPVEIGDRAFLGNNVTVLKGVRIGQNAVIGAGSVVTKDVPDNAIAAGNPCRVIRYTTT